MSIVIKAATQEALREEHARSVKKHGDWNNRNIDDCFNAILAELKELECAVVQNHKTGPHSIEVESLHVAVTALKLYQKIKHERNTDERQ